MHRMIRYQAVMVGLPLLLSGCGVLFQALNFPSGPSSEPVVTLAGYRCDSLLTPAPSESPGTLPSAGPTAPSPTPRLGFTTDILGRNHVRDLNAVIEYAFCPPTSGDHFNVTNRGPIRAAVYPANEEQIPGGWLHNMEHGYVVALYRCQSGVLGQGDCISAAEMAQMQAFFDQAPTSINPSCKTKVVVARFDSMDTRFALLAWGRALLVDEFDLDTALLFAQQWTDYPAVPERGLC